MLRDRPAAGEGEWHPSRLVLLGMEPNEPEPEYGYILPEDAAAGPSEARRIVRFVWKPDGGTARRLIVHGALWNTLVMVFRTKTLLGVVRGLAAEIYRSFERLLPAIGAHAEAEVMEAVYQKLPPLNFLKGLLEALPQARRVALFVLSVRGVFWSDCGLPRNVQSALMKTGYQPPDYETEQNPPAHVARQPIFSKLVRKTQ
ncbi:MAG: hypothetical protein HYT78_18700 [Deltaproteobacteria bacterium]|nr:hypothetical protein [Deltaproteobacteria bacterium]